MIINQLEFYSRVFFLKLYIPYSIAVKLGDINLKEKTLALLTALLLMATFLPAVFADVPLTSRFDATGHYSMVAAGVGLAGTSSGSISVSVPETATIVAAYLYWAGIAPQGSGDAAITFDVTDLTADTTLEEEWGFGNYYSYVYIESVTSLVSPGANTYSIDNVDITVNYGAGLVVIYEDSSLPVNRVMLMDGADGFWFDWAPDLGPNSDVACFQFDADTCNRNADMFLFSAGTEHDDRPNEVWTLTGTGTPIEDIVNYVGAETSGETYPLFASDGPSWDTYNDDVEVSASDEWLCVQIESIESWEDPLHTAPYIGRGTSGLFIATGLVLPSCCDEYEGFTPGFWKNHACAPRNAWPPTGYAPGDSFESIFGVDVTLRGKGKATISEPTLLEALDANGGGINALARHAVAALLNAAHPDVNYPLSTSEIIDAVHDAIINGEPAITDLKNELDAFNNAGGDM
jgi:hypothetical protein